MDRVPTDGPEIDICRRCQMMWFDAGDLEELPRRSDDALAAARWQEELRQMQRRRENRECYARLIRRRASVGPF